MSNGNVFFANGFHHIRKLTELNATGNDLSGVPPGLLSLVSSKLDRLQLEHNPLLSAIPGEFEHGYRSADSPQLLKHLALLKLYTECRLRLTGKTGLAESGTCKSSDKSSDGWRYWTDVYLLTQRCRSGSCCWCNHARFGSGVSVCHHCVSILNYSQVPIMFNCCGPRCAHQAAQCSAEEFQTRFYPPRWITPNGSSENGFNLHNLSGNPAE
ncbi:hypothetical protein FBUS_02725 [Fasciolopsis buskii]|uniref:Uncharacterized protein n=1 Tax=Fasciolopsis buskii TaxID=27845 RepID=A0A8E0RSK4_9TREM|nr:hypothetical protein FBUS_02725 [Fasciolopsis buski]